MWWRKGEKITNFFFNKWKKMLGIWLLKIYFYCFNNDHYIWSTNGNNVKSVES